MEEEYQELEQALDANERYDDRRNRLIFKEYKIHFMPKPEYFFPCVAKLVKIISGDILLKANLHTLKVAINPHEQLERNTYLPPMIVVYPLLGKDHAEFALQRLFQHFESDLAMGSHQTPRFNVVTNNPLITYAQGDGHQKSMIHMQNPELFSQMFEEDGSHFNLSLGTDFHLNTPKGF